VKLVLYKISVT